MGLTAVTRTPIQRRSGNREGDESENTSEDLS